MQVHPEPPFSAAVFFWRLGDARTLLTAVVKAAFSVGPDGAARAASPPALRARDALGGAPPTAFHPGDLQPYKPHAEVVAVGHVHAHGDSSGRVRASVRVGSIAKSLLVFGERRLVRSGQFSIGAPHRFESMPLTYARSARSIANPIGIDIMHESCIAMPNFEFDPAAPTPYVGLGPMPPGWPARRSGGKDPAEVERARAAFAEAVAAQAERGAPDDPRSLPNLPTAFDFAAFNLAPPDQRAPKLDLAAPIALDHLLAIAPRLVVRLPAVTPAVTASGPGLLQFGPVVLDTLAIDADASTVTATWRASADVNDYAAARRAAVAVRRGQLSQGARASMPALDDAAPPNALGAAAGPKPPDDPKPDLEQGVTMSIDLAPAAATALPFGGAAAPDPSEPPQAMTLPIDSGRTFSGAPVHPFAPAPAPQAPALVPSPIEVMAGARAPLTTAEAPLTSAEAPLTTAEPPFAPAPVAPAPVAPAPAPEASAESAGPQAPSLEDYAGLSALIAHAPASRDAVLLDAGLHRGEWERLARRMEADIQADPALAIRFDEAFVKRHPTLGALGVLEYADVSLAVERGETKSVLAKLGVPFRDLMRLQRVWMRRSAQDPELGAALRAAVTERRTAP